MVRLFAILINRIDSMVGARNNMVSSKTNTLFAALLVCCVISLRAIVPSFWDDAVNFAPFAAISLFSGACFPKKGGAYLWPLLLFFISDIFVNKVYFGHWTLFYPGFYWQYGSYILIACLGMVLADNRKPLRVLGVSLSASLIFFIISNFGVWVGWHTYPHTFSGLMACYLAAIPFYKATLGSDLLYLVMLFGIYGWYTQRLTSEKHIYLHHN